jgi:hypothetical protein
MLIPKIVREFGVRHEVEPHQLHGCAPGNFWGLAVSSLGGFNCRSSCLL